MSENENNPLAKELAAFNREFPKLSSSMGSFAVFFEEKLVGIYSTPQEAFENGYKAASTKPFLVKQITSLPNIQHFSRAVKFTCLTSS